MDRYRHQKSSSLTKDMTQTTFAKRSQTKVAHQLFRPSPIAKKALIDGITYALRNQVERCFNKVKCSRRLATRYDKTAASYLGFIHIAAARLWFRSLST